MLGKTVMLKIMVPGEGITNKNMLCPWKEEPEALQVNTRTRIVPRQDHHIRQVLMNVAQIGNEPKNV